MNPKLHEEVDLMQDISEDDIDAVLRSQEMMEQEEYEELDVSELTDVFDQVLGG